MFDKNGFGGSSAMHVVVAPNTGTYGLLQFNIDKLVSDGKPDAVTRCAVTCSVDVKILQRGKASTNTRILTLLTPGTEIPNITHSSTFSYFSRSATPEAPDLGAIGNGAFSHLQIDVDPSMTGITGSALVDAKGDTKTLAQMVYAVEIGLHKSAADDQPLDAVFDNVLCKARPPGPAR